MALRVVRAGRGKCAATADDRRRVVRGVGRRIHNSMPNRYGRTLMRCDCVDYEDYGRCDCDLWEDDSEDDCECETDYVTDDYSEDLWHDLQN